MNQKKYYRSSELKQRGWTEGLIRKFLPKPDETKTNPIVKSAAPMKLFLLDSPPSLLHHQCLSVEHTHVDDY